jgi:hypothetical protein
VVVAGALRDLLTEDKRRSEVVVSGAGEALRGALAGLAVSAREVAGELVLEVEGDAGVRAVIEKVLASGAALRSVNPKRERLEDLFVREVL